MRHDQQPGNNRSRAVQTFRELEVYQRAFATAQRIYELSKSFPAEERYSLTDQVRRSSRGVTTNIAEAWRKRRYARSFVSKLTDADAEAAETSVWLDHAHACGFLSSEALAHLRREYYDIGGKLTRMMNQSEQWCAHARKTS